MPSGVITFGGVTDHCGVTVCTAPSESRDVACTWRRDPTTV
jgi:hypothetical protein